MPFFSSLCHLVWTNWAKNGALQAFIAHKIKARFAIYSIERVGTAHCCQSASAGLRSTQALHFLQYLWLRPNQAWLILESFTRGTVPSHWNSVFFGSLFLPTNNTHGWRKTFESLTSRRAAYCMWSWVRKYVLVFSPRLWHADSFQGVYQMRRVLSFKISSLQEHEPGPFRSQTLLYSVWLQGHSSSAYLLKSVTHKYLICCCNLWKYFIKMVYQTWYIWFGVFAVKA